MKSYKFSIMIGRYQPFHHGHYELFKTALKLADTIIIVIGSYKKSPDVENPWPAEKREEMIRAALTDEELRHVKFVYVRDYWYINDQWLTEVQQLVYEATDGCEDGQICNIGATDDFPQWKFFFQKEMKAFPHATEIRELYFTHDVTYKNSLHSNVVQRLEKFKDTETFKLLKNSFDYLANEHVKWDGSPRPVTFVTVDAVVVKSGHILLVRRKGALGKGQLALPGGFLNQSETARTGALRELKEETAINLDRNFLDSSIRGEKVFDYPKRSLRGRVITHAFFLNLGKGPLPRVKGEDDADKAFWMSWREFMTREEEFFEDHFHIISYFSGGFKNFSEREDL